MRLREDTSRVPCHDAQGGLRQEVISKHKSMHISGTLFCPKDRLRFAPGRHGCSKCGGVLIHIGQVIKASRANPSNDICIGCHAIISEFRAIAPKRTGMTHAFRVGDWLIEPDLSRISRADREDTLEPKAIEVLLCLARHAGEVLPKKEIIKAVWPDTFVSDGVLTYSISELRKAFADDVKNPQIIQTIPRRGYRLIAPVSEDLRAAKLRPSIAVLPFDDMSPEKDQGYFAMALPRRFSMTLRTSRALTLRRGPRHYCCS